MLERLAVLLVLAGGCADDDEACEEPDFTLTSRTVVCDSDRGAHAVFNAMWSAFDQRYAVFAERLGGRDWRALGQDGCAALAADAPPEQLYERLLPLARALDDGHVVITADDLDRDDDGWVSVYPHIDRMEDLEGNVEARYTGGALTDAAADEFAWGRIGSIGYVSITSMDALSDSEEEDDDLAAADAAMARVVAELADTDGLVIDVRANEGGWDTVSLRIVSWLAGTEGIAWSEQRRDGPAHDSLGAAVPTTLPAGVPGAYPGPVVVLTSGLTFSAAETFTLAVRERPQVTVLGESTSGHFSDADETCLPNGWTLSLSTERYLAADGSIYEGAGVPPDLTVAFDPAAFDEGRDVMLDAALAELGG